MTWRWPWQAPEARQQPFGDAIASALEAQATGTTAGDPSALSALEACAGMWARAMGAARLEPEIPAVTPAVLALIGRCLIRRGEAVFAIDVDGGAPALRPCGSWDVRGPWREADWKYRIDLFGPSGNITRFVPSGAVVHTRFAIDPARPWLGLGPLQWARTGASLAANAELRLSEEAGGAVARVLPLPYDQHGEDGEDDDRHKNLKAGLRAAKGRLTFARTTAGGWDGGRTEAPQTDWKQQRIGPDPSDSFRTLYGQGCEMVIAACGVPQALIGGKADGTLARESWRMFLHGAVRPVARTVADELARKFDVPGLTMNFGDLYASDIAGRAQVFQRLVANDKVDVERALALSGLLMDEAA